MVAEGLRASTKPDPEKGAVQERRALALCRLANRYDFRRGCIEWRYAHGVSMAGASWTLAEPDTVVMTVAAACGAVLVSAARGSSDGLVVVQGELDTFVGSVQASSLLAGARKLVLWVEPSARCRPPLARLRAMLADGACASLLMMGSLEEFERAVLGVEREGELRRASSSDLLERAEREQARVLRLLRDDAPSETMLSQTRSRQLALESATIDLFTVASLYQAQQRMAGGRCENGELAS